MKNYTLEQRAEFYNRTFPYPRLFVSKRMWKGIIGVWWIGNDYTNISKMYGAYPHSYLKRVLSLFPDRERVLHLFSGSLPKTTEGVRFDIRKECEPDILGDAHRLSEYILPEKKDLVIVDPPYSIEDAMHYGTPMINRNIVIKECVKILEPNAFLVWLDQIFPMYTSEEIKVVGTIGLIRSTNHRYRVVSIFKRESPPKGLMESYR